mmetsp:Transcript_28888/g.78257  ORF Transcript_28888/g.78257 Transcript_28888/m.78257 type:complete len:204 (-) Transcript_28888:356-967(-)
MVENAEVSQSESILISVPVDISIFLLDSSPFEVTVVISLKERNTSLFLSMSARRIVCVCSTALLPLFFVSLHEFTRLRKGNVRCICCLMSSSISFRICFSFPRGCSRSRWVDNCRTAAANPIGAFIFSHCLESKAGSCHSFTTYSLRILWQTVAKTSESAERPIVMAIFRTSVSAGDITRDEECGPSELLPRRVRDPPFQTMT